MKKTRLIIIVLAVIVAGVAAAAVFYYTTQLSLSIKGEKSVTVNLNSVYEEQGVSAREHGEDVSDKVKITGNVDTSIPGTYEIRYSVGSLSAVRTVKVLDKMNPELLLEELPQDYSMMLGDEFEEPGYSAADESGKDITGRVEVSGNEFNKAGKNIVEYTVSDDKGNTTKVTREVNVEPNTDYGSAGLPICMYHYVYDENDPPEDLERRYGNYISVSDLEEELNWLNDEGYYYPTWEEVREYTDGKLLLPEKSIVLCFDDGEESFLENGIPVLEKCKVPATCFMITSKDGEKKIAEHESEYVTYESHSHDMHRAGGYIGHGGIFTAMLWEDGMTDLKESVEICGSGDAFAYPYGDYTMDCRNMVEEAGFLCAVTTEYGKAFPGSDPLLLPRIRMVVDQSMESFISQVAPAEQ